jgi:pimeloyl-ACP methyl ester carboxylesterase
MTLDTHRGMDLNHHPGIDLDHHRGGSGEPLVLVHGLGHTWRGWKPMLPLLEQDFDVLAVDLPGFGYSPPLPPGTASNPETLADAVEAAMDAAGFETAHVAGNSLGGWIALELGRRGRARTVTAISPAGMWHGRERGWTSAVMRTLHWIAGHMPTPEPLLRTAAGRTLLAGPLFARPWRIEPDDLAETLHLYATAPGFEETLERSLAGQVRGLDEIECPVLLLWGGRDILLLPRQARRFERVIADCELRYMKGLGHTPMADDPELLAEEIRRRCARRAAAPA